MFGIIADVIASALTMLLPAYLSYKALRSHDPAQINPWLIYFTILSLALLFESWTVFILGWIPFYSWIRLIFLLYLVLPQTQGAKLLYLNYLEPYIVSHETKIDQFIAETHARLHQLGLGYLNALIDLIRERVLGQKSPQPPPSAASTGAQGYASFATDLMSRWAMPGARSAAPNTSAAGNAGVYGMMSSFAGAAFGAATGNGSRSRDVSGSHHEPFAIPSSLVDDISRSSMSNAEKSSALSQQRDRLSAMLKSLDAEQQNLDLAYGGAAHLGTGLATGTPSRSERSFERVDHADAYSSHDSSPRPRHGHSSSGRKSAGSHGRHYDDSSSSSDSDDHHRRRKSGRQSAGWSTAKDITDAISHGATSGYDHRR